MLSNNSNKKFKFNNLIFFFLSVFILITPLQAKEINDFYKKKFCDKVNPVNFFNQKIPSEIIIETDNPKKWSKNIFSLLVELNSEKFKTNNKDWYTFQIDRIYKKKFKSKIKFVFKDPDYECTSKGKINIRGDLWWHLDWENGHPVSSVKVNLKNGHLNNRVKFNLLMPKSRQAINGNINLELFVTSLFNKLNLLAPKSNLIKAKINGQQKIFLFQEALSKEFLESRKLLEGPILEGDQRFTAEQFSNNKWRGDLGLAKIINTSYALKNRVNADISFYALSILNNIFTDSANSADKKKRCTHEYLPIDEKKYFKTERETKAHQIYEALIFATETDHSFTCDDRKFYFDPLEKIFLPIYNDGKSTLNIDNKDIYLKIKNSNSTLNAKEGADFALELIKNINDKLFFKELILTGFSMSYNDYKKLKTKVENNLIALKKTEPKPIANSTPSYFKDINPNYFGKEVKLVFLDTENNHLKICDFKLKNCKRHKIKKDHDIIFKSLLEQNFLLLKKNKILSFNNNNHYLFLSTDTNYSTIKKLKTRKNIFKQKRINNTFSIEYNSSTKVFVDNDKKNIKFILSDPSSRIKVIGDLVDSWKFEIDGSIYFKEKKDKKYMYNSSSLTGCLTFTDITLKNVKLKSNYSLCEDAFNLIRTDGNIYHVEINNSFSDGLDLDFSDIEINSINIMNSTNDCLDMSFGEYKIFDSKFFDCGDKAISVGEKSNVSISNLIIERANIGIAAKDSSNVYVENSNIQSNICFAAYRKKQEFSGAILVYKNTNCKKKNFVTQKGSLIKQK